MAPEMDNDGELQEALAAAAAVALGTVRASLSGPLAAAAVEATRMRPLQGGDIACTPVSLMLPLDSAGLSMSTRARRRRTRLGSCRNSR